MIAVGCDDVVVAFSAASRADGDRLLADVEVEEAADLPLRVAPCRFLLDSGGW